MLSVSLTKIEAIDYLLSNLHRNDETMPGKIRTKEKCPKCGQAFEYLGEKIGYLCREHLTIPQRFFIDVYYGRQLKIYSHKTGLVLSSYDLALETLKHIQYEIRNKSFDPSKYVAADIKNFLFESKMDDWLFIKQNIDQIRVIDKYKQFKRDYFSFFTGRDVRDIRTTHIDDFFMQLPGRLSDKTKKNILACLRSFFSWLKKKEVIETIPIFPNIELDDPDWKWVDVDVQATIITKIPIEHRPLFLFLALHGCRPSEGRALKIKDINFAPGSITIRRTFTGKSGNELNELKEPGEKKRRDRTKTGKIRIIPINEEMLDFLIELCKNRFGEDFVFVNPRTEKYYSKTIFGDIWREACKNAGVKITAYEGLRHSWASQRVSRGISLYLVSKVLGHTDSRTSERYSHTNLDGLKTAMNLPSLTRLSPDYPQIEKSEKISKVNQ
jgi:integrase